MILAPASDGTAIVVCSTCRVSQDAREDAEGERGGALLARQLIAAAQASEAYAGIAIETMPCLFACARHCTVHVRAPGKIGYVLGDFAPDEEAARALLDYALAHHASAEGQVRYADWPDGVKGHFIVRVPPEAKLAT